MSKRLAILLFAVTACERADAIAPEPTAAPVIEAPPGASAMVERLSPHAELVDRVEPPPPPTPGELRVDRLRHWYGLLSMEAREGVRQVCQWNQDNPCGMLLQIGPVPRQDPRPGMLAAVATSERELVEPYCDAMYGQTVCDTPLVVAFEGEAIAFDDHWPTATTPWLALDRDGDGAITSKAELFGDSTLLAAGTRAHNGFQALAALDDNRDGVIDRQDAAFSQLLLWADRDGSRRSSPSELSRAADVLVAIPLANERDVRCTADDDCEGERGEVQWRGADGGMRRGALVDVYIH